MVNSCGRNGIFSDFCDMDDVSPTILLILQSNFILSSKQQKEWISWISMCWSGNVIFSWGHHVPDPWLWLRNAVPKSWLVHVWSKTCGKLKLYSNQKGHKQSKTPRPDLDMSGHPCSGRKTLLINPAVGMKSTRIILWRTPQFWDMPWWLWSSLYSILKQLWGKYTPSALQEREAIL